MGSRLELHNELLKLIPNAYFQPPSNIQLIYPCIVYHKNSKDIMNANNGKYLSTQEYRLTLIEKKADSPLADAIENSFNHCSITGYYVMDGLNHTTLNLYY